MDELSILRARVTVLERRVEEIRVLLHESFKAFNGPVARTPDDMVWDYNMATFGVGDPLREEEDEMEESAPMAD